jgi:hypothetical protein
MRIGFSILTIMVMLAAGCSTVGESRTKFEIVCFGTDRRLLTITRQEWDGGFGPDGYVGYRAHNYDIKLLGLGPEFTNPWVREDRSPSTTFSGTVALDITNMQVTLNILKTPFGSKRSERFMDGTYEIDAVRDANKADKFAYPEATW